MSQGKRYSREFKVEAVKLVVENGYSMAEVARKVGIAPSTLRPWIDKYRDEPLTASQRKFPTAEEELLQLRKEVRDLKQEPASGGKHYLFPQTAVPGLLLNIFCRQ